jgi:uncharacterized protein YidB (DUF937 family)
MAQNMFGSDSGSAVPGGNVAKPLMIALLALLASRYFGGSKAEPAPEMPKLPKMPEPVPQPQSLPDPGSVLDGLGGLIKQFQQKGFGDAVDSWVGTGKNQDVAPKDVSVALGGDVVDELASRTGLTRDQVIGELARMLPNMVDKLTPNGRLPTQAEVMRLMS